MAPVGSLARSLPPDCCRTADAADAAIPPVQMGFPGPYHAEENLLMSGVLERHPRLHVVSVESRLGWLPFLLNGLDYRVTECTPPIAEHVSMKPSEYFRRQVHC